MDTSQWRRVADISELKEGTPKIVTVDEEDILLIKKDNRIHAYGNSCTHYGAPLNEGHFSKHEVTCPWHNARFNLENGKMTAPPALDDLPQYEVNIENNEIYIGKKRIPEIPKPDKIDESTTILIIGGGASGNAAVETLRREGYSGKITMITQEDDRPYDRPTLSKPFMAGKAKPKWLPLRSPEFYQTRQIDLVTNKRITDFNAEEKFAIAENGNRFQFDKCLLATGGVPNKLPVPGVELKNIFSLRSFQDARQIDSAVKDAKNVLIVGAGFIGLEVAGSLNERGIPASIVAPEKIPLAQLFGDDVGRFFQQLHEENGVKFYLGQTVSEFRGDESVEEAVLSDNRSIKTDLVIIAIGVHPGVDYLKNTNLVQNGAIPVDSQLITKTEGIYAAGDIAVVPNPYTNETHRIEHWTVAERQGRHAAKSMLGEKHPYQEVPFFWTRQYGKSFKCVGYIGDFDRVASRGNVDKGTFLTGYFLNGRFKAAATIGMGKDLFALEKLLESGKNVTFEQFQDETVDFGSLS